MVFYTHIKPSLIYKWGMLSLLYGILLLSILFTFVYIDAVWWQSIVVLCVAALLVLSLSIWQKNRYNAVSIDQNGELFLHASKNHQQIVRTNLVKLQSKQIVLPYFILLRFTIESESKRHYLLLFPDSMATAAFRTLSVWLLGQGMKSE